MGDDRTLPARQCGGKHPSAVVGGQVSDAKDTSKDIVEVPGCDCARN